MTALQKAFVTALVLVFFTFLLIGFPDHPHAQVTQTQAACAPRATIVQNLSEKYGESVIAQGLNQTKQIMEVFATKDGATWTITVRSAEGIMCILATGTHWGVVTPKLDKKSSF